MSKKPNQPSFEELRKEIRAVTNRVNDKAGRLFIFLEEKDGLFNLYLNDVDDFIAPEKALAKLKELDAEMVYESSYDE